MTLLERSSATQRLNSCCVKIHFLAFTPKVRRCGRSGTGGSCSRSHRLNPTESHCALRVCDYFTLRGACCVQSPGLQERPRLLLLCISMELSTRTWAYRIASFVILFSVG